MLLLPWLLADLTSKLFTYMLCCYLELESIGFSLENICKYKPPQSSICSFIPERNTSPWFSFSLSLTRVGFIPILLQILLKDTIKVSVSDERLSEEDDAAVEKSACDVCHLPFCGPLHKVSDQREAPVFSRGLMADLTKVMNNNNKDEK